MGNATRPAPRGHANSPRPLQRAFGARSAPDPVLDDCLLSAAALCAEIAAEDLATLASAGEFSASWASEMRRTGGKGGFLHKTTVLTYRLARRNASRAWMVVAHFKATLKQALMPTTDEELVARFWDLMDAENDCEGVENGVTARLARTHDLEALKKAAAAEAAVQEELMAVIQELQRRRIDPFAKAAGN